MTRWTDIEREVVDNAWDAIDAWESYRLTFGFKKRTFDGIKRQWYRAHPRVI